MAASLPYTWYMAVFKPVVKDFCNYIFEASFDLPKECESFEYENFMDSQVTVNYVIYSTVVSNAYKVQYY